MRTLNKLLLISVITCISGCANTPFPFLYKMDVQQGNVISAEMVDQIHAGMSKDQVVAIMGGPVLTDVFNPQRFDYVYTNQHRAQPIYQQRVVVQFMYDRVVGVYRYGI